MPSEGNQNVSTDMSRGTKAKNAGGENEITSNSKAVWTGDKLARPTRRSDGAHHSREKKLTPAFSGARKSNRVLCRHETRIRPACSCSCARTRNHPGLTTHAGCRIKNQGENLSAHAKTDQNPRTINTKSSREHKVCRALE
jgi:hypothetical protein